MMKTCLALTLALISCTEVQLSGHAARSNPNSKSADVKPFSGNEAPTDTSADTKSPESNAETADTPKVVSGAYLHCSSISERSNSVELGCHLLDQDQVRIEAKSIAKSFDYSIETVEESGLKISTMRKVHKDRVYDVIYRFQANSLREAKRSAEDAFVKVAVEDPKPGFASNYEGRVSAIIRPALIENNFIVQSVDGVPSIVRDLVLGASFYRNSGAARNWSEAVSDCLSVVVGKWEKWKIAEKDSLMAAHEHGLGQLLDVAKILAMPGKKAWTSAISNEMDTIGQGIFYDPSSSDGMNAFGSQDIELPLAPAVCQH
jgi:hypothetical protein